MAATTASTAPAETRPIPQVVRDDPWLEPWTSAVCDRMDALRAKRAEIELAEGSLEAFSRGYQKFGFNYEAGKGWVFREWAPGATSVHLIGDFNGWNRESHALQRDAYGVWSIALADGADGAPGIAHNTKVKLQVGFADGTRGDRLPAWIRRVTQEPRSPVLDAVHWAPPEPHRWRHDGAARCGAGGDLRIYEAHVGMSSEQPRIATYGEFRRDVLPRVAALGYNAVQLMAVMEHAYYASFGYQVTNFFAVSSRCGTPEELKELVDEAHRLGLAVLLDVVHSHASKNVLDGLNQLDGTDHHYFHAGPRGHHALWDSRLFNYGHWEVLRFLLSNLRWWVDEYHFDGFRFDGITSMLYRHHGLAHAFADGYNEYFGAAVDDEAVLYLGLANQLLHELPRAAITVAEDVSGFVGLCRPVADGGIGFDYRLAMGIPDLWIRTFKDDVRDEQWSMGEIVHTLTNRRHREATIAYAESHDQALVGDKTIAFWLMDKEMYTEMSVMQPLTPVVDRGIALHKMIRLITCALGGEGYLCFMGNEFGHPEWIDFPREGNNDSFHYCRRQWNLPRDPLLRYKFLEAFDSAMLHLEARRRWLPAPQAYVSRKHEGDKIIAFERADLLFVFNFHPSQSFQDYRIGVDRPGKYTLLLDSDAADFGGHSRVQADSAYFTQPMPHDGRSHSLMVYIPCRTALVLGVAPEE